MTRQVLIVDDDRQMVRTLSDIVRLHGWSPDTAYSGEAAVEAVRNHAYRAVLMDVRMTGINGVEAFKEMKALRPGIPVILMTAYTAADIMVEAEREGALKVLSKPVVLSGLLEMLEQTEELKPVLIVADDAVFLTDLCAALTERGYRTLRAENLSDALVTIEKKSPAAVVLDLQLDGISSDECAVAIRRVSPGVALILCNGRTTDGVRQAEPAGTRLIYAGLRKPFAPERLIEILDDIFAD